MLQNKIVLTSNVEVSDEYDVAELLRYIAQCIEDGFGTSHQQGFDPQWEININYNKKEEEDDTTI